MIVVHLKPAGSPNDAVVGRLVKDILPSVGSMVLKLLNHSLLSGVVHGNFKDTIMLSLIKKPAHVPTCLANCRSISKLPFLSKVLEKIVHSQIIAFS